MKRGIGITIAAVCVVLAVAVAIVGVTFIVQIRHSMDGSALADDAVSSTAAAIESRVDGFTSVPDPETVAAYHFGDRYPAEVVPLSWERGDNGTVVISARIHKAVEALSPETVFGRQNSAGEATRCYRYEIGVYDARRTEVACDGLPNPERSPTPTPEPGLPDDAEARLGALLTTTAPDEIAIALSQEFPEATVTETEVTPGGEVVAAVGYPGGPCLVLVHRPDGVIERVSFRQIWLQPGETGCATALYTNPPR
ncbi:hypothetical protein PFZ55_51440 [Streptomyces sp. MS2A]|nr:hypothetical protein [Streptomyces sp. MS2A]